MSVSCRETLIPFLLMLAFLGLVACDGGEVPLGGVIPGEDDETEEPVEPPLPGQLRLLPNAPYDLSQIRLNWGVVPDATVYRLYRNPGNVPTPEDEDDPRPGYEQIGNDFAAPPAGVPGITFVDVLPVHLTDWQNLSYILETCNEAGCQDSRAFFLPASANCDGVCALTSRHNLKTSVVGRGEPRTPLNRNLLGSSIAVARDGETIVLGTSVDAGNLGDAPDKTGSAYVFTRDGFDWEERARLRAADANLVVANDFGRAVAASANGGTIAVGAPSAQVAGSGAAGKVYVFTGDGEDWTEQAMLQAPNAAAQSLYGRALALSDDGSTLVVGAPQEDGGTSGTAPAPPADGGTLSNSGAVYVYRRSGSAWNLEAYIKPPATRPEAQFGGSVALSADGATLAVGAPQERSAARGVNGDMIDDCGTAEPVNCTRGAGAAHVYVRDGDSWSHQTYLKASNTEICPPPPDDDNCSGDEFGSALAISASGNDLLVGAPREDSVARYGSDDLASSEAQENNSASEAGAAYLFRRDSGNWEQLVYLKSHNTSVDASHAALFGSAVAISNNGALLAIGAPFEDGRAIGIGGDASDLGSNTNHGAVYLYDLASGFFAYIKETHRDGLVTRQNNFGAAVGLSGDGFTLAAGAPGDDYAWNSSIAEVASFAGTVSSRYPDPLEIMSREDSGAFYVY